MIKISTSERVHNQLSRGGTGELLLPRDQIAVPHGEGLEHRLNHEVRVFEFAGLFLYPKRLDFLADEVVGELLFCAGKPRPGLSLDKQRPVREPGFQQDRRAVAHDADDLSCLIGFGDERMQFSVVNHGHHGGLATCYENSVVVIQRDISNGFGALQQRAVGCRFFEAEQDDVMGGVLAVVFGAGEPIGRQIAALG